LIEWGMDVENRRHVTPNDVEPLDSLRPARPKPQPRPRRLIEHVYLAAGLCVLCFVFDLESRFEPQTVHLATIRAIVGAYGVIATGWCFGLGGLRRSDKVPVLVAGKVCLLFAVEAMLLRA
jgi:hypothetical protein